MYIYKVYMHMHSSPSSEKDHPGTIVVFANTLLFAYNMYFYFYFPPSSVLFSASKIPSGNLNLSSTPQLLKSQMLFQWQLVIKMPVLTLFHLKRSAPWSCNQLHMYWPFQRSVHSNAISTFVLKCEMLNTYWFSFYAGKWAKRSCNVHKLPLAMMDMEENV